MNKVCLWLMIGVICLGILGGALVTYAGDIEAVLDTDDGSSAFKIKDSGSATVGSIDSDGNLVINGFQLGTSTTAGNVLTADASGVGTWVAGDPWTIVKLESDFTISTTSNNEVTGLYFTPAANKQYLILGYFSIQTATTTVGPRPGVAWPSGTTLEVGRMTASSSSTAFVTRNWGAGTTSNAASTGLPVANEGYFAELKAMVKMGASPSGNFRITLASETGGTNVTMRAGSLIMYREL